MITRRPATAEDTEFLWQVQRQTLGEYVSTQFGTTESQQRQYFDEHFDVSRHSILLRKEEAIGFLFHENRADHIFLGNIAILPAYQSQGIGTELIQGIIEEAAASHAPTPPVELPIRTIFRFHT